MSLHANVAVPARDRSRLERLCRYVARPPLATARLSRTGDGRLLYRLKHRWRDGTTHVVFEPLELVEKLAALIPPPRFHGARYHGVFAPCARERARVVPAAAVGPVESERPRARERAAVPISAPASAAPSAGREECDAELATSVRAEAADEGRAATAAPLGPPPAVARPRRLTWAALLQRVFAIDVLECPRCGGRARVLSVSLPPDAVHAILDCLGLPSRAPPDAAARGDELEASEFHATD